MSKYRINVFGVLKLTPKQKRARKKARQQKLSRKINRKNAKRK